MTPKSGNGGKEMPVDAKRLSAGLEAQTARAPERVQEILRALGPEAACRECERVNLAALRESEEGYRLLFASHPMPMWVFDRKTLRFLAVNDATVRQYGYTEQEFLAMTIREIRPPEDVPALLADVAKRTMGLQNPGQWRHRRKNGEIFYVEIISHSLVFRGIDAMLVAAEDVTERRHAAELLQNSEMKYRALFHDSADAYWLADANGIVDCNAAARELFGYADGERMPHPRTLSPPTQPDGSGSLVASMEHVAVAVRNGKERFEWMHRRKSGETFHAEVSLTALQMGGIPLLLGSVRDITKRKMAEEALRQAEERYRATFEDALVGIFQAGPDGRLLHVNRTLAQMHGFDSPEEMLATITNSAEQIFVDLRRRDELRRELWEHGVVHRAEVQLYRKDRATLWGIVNLRLARNSNGEVRFLEGIVEDITDRKAAEERNHFLAYNDSLTGLPHRTLLQDRLDQALAGARRRKERVAVLFLDLDRFKVYNDSLGHEFGDLLLKGVAERLRGCAREQDTVARFGGDEFVVILHSVKDAAAAGHAAERIMKALARDFTIQGRCVSIRCSMGISLFPDDGADGTTLIKNADVAMYAAKEAGRNTFRVFTEEMRRRAEERTAIESNLRLALERNEFFLLYQPQMEIESGRITGVEALIRWQHPVLGLVTPDKFISIAEDCGLMLPIGEWVLRTACTQARRWQRDGLLAGPVAVNVSPVQFRHEGFVETIRSVLLETGLPPEHLELELTEGLLLSNVAVTSTVLRELKQMGVKLAIDDFGTGYSSLSYLLQFPVSKLKIDRSFVCDLSTNPDEGVIIVAILGMAKGLKLRVIAEGVEDEAQLSFLRDHGCAEIQGYYFSRPIAAVEITAKLACKRAPARVLAMPIRAACAPEPML